GRAARPPERRRDGALRAGAAGGERHPRGDGAAHEGNVMAVTTPAACGVASATPQAGRRAVFFDKDGTLIEDVPYNEDPALIRLAPGASEALRLLRDAGFRLIVVSNQSGVAHGLFPESALCNVEAKLRELLAAAGVALDGFYWCPHHPSGSVAAYAVACDC